MMAARNISFPQFLMFRRNFSLLFYFRFSDKIPHFSVVSSIRFFLFSGKGNLCRKLRQFWDFFVLHLFTHGAVLILQTIIWAILEAVTQKTLHFVLIQIHVAKIFFVFLVVLIIHTAFSVHGTLAFFRTTVCLPQIYEGLRCPLSDK